MPKDRLCCADCFHELTFKKKIKGAWKSVGPSFCFNKPDTVDDNGADSLEINLTDTVCANYLSHKDGEEKANKPCLL
jgi:hypothetical protein